MSRKLCVNFYPPVPQITRKLKSSTMGLACFVHSGNTRYTVNGREHFKWVFPAGCLEASKNRTVDFALNN